MLEKNTTWSIARVFFDEPSQTHFLREIGRKAGIAHTALAKHLKTLKEHNIIEETAHTQGKKRFSGYIAKQESDSYKAYRRLDVLERIEACALVPFLETACSPDCVVLFGSASRGEDSEESDIDVFLQARETAVDTRKLERVLKRKVHLHMRSRFAEYPKELRLNIANGIVLYGFLEAA